MNSIENYQKQAEKMPFIEKLNFLLTLLEDGEIEEAEAYDILTEKGKPTEPPQREKAHIFIF